ncbi:MAG: hypothetical protein JWM78_3551 [Verrucomicrobiaceae bacterium]|nr:hypothetical protein [Verrucomicrobiaceae bacterium]
MNSIVKISALLLGGACISSGAWAALPQECTNWQQNHAQWLWCDDFEADSSLEQNYYDVNRMGGHFGVSADAAYAGSHALKNGYQKGVESAGWLKFSFGKTPVSPKRYLDKKFDDVYWRFYVKTSANWSGPAMKLTRATVFSSSKWAQAAIGHVWEDGKLGLGLDPVSGVSGSTVITTGWNDFAHMKWLGEATNSVQIYAPENRDKWFCVEAHMKLNTPNKSDGVYELWINDQVQGTKSTLNFRGGYTDYGINTIMLEGWFNGGAKQNQERYFDNFVVSTAKIGCYNPTATTTSSPPAAPNLSVKPQ